MCISGVCVCVRVSLFVFVNSRKLWRSFINCVNCLTFECVDVCVSECVCVNGRVCLTFWTLACAPSLKATESRPWPGNSYEKQTKQNNNSDTQNSHKAKWRKNTYNNNNKSVIGQHWSEHPAGVGGRESIGLVLAHTLATHIEIVVAFDLLCVLRSASIISHKWQIVCCCYCCCSCKLNTLNR